MKQSKNVMDQLVWVWDNGGTNRLRGTFDRYTVIMKQDFRCVGLERWQGIGMSVDPYHPQGFGQTFALTDKSVCTPDHGKRIRLEDLPVQARMCAVRFIKSMLDPVFSDEKKEKKP